MNVMYPTRVVLDKEPALAAIWLVYGSVALAGFLICRLKARWLALFLPLSLALSVPGISELHNVGREIFYESPLYYFQSCVAIFLAMSGPAWGGAHSLRRNSAERRATAVWIGAASALLAVASFRAGFGGTSALFLMDPTVKLTADLVPIPGRVHRGVRGYGTIVTREDTARAESYWIVLLGAKGNRVKSCGEWTASRLPVLVIGHFDPPCFLGGGGRNSVLPVADRNLVVTQGRIEFTASDGKRLRISR